MPKDLSVVRFLNFESPMYSVARPQGAQKGSDGCAGF